MSNLILRVLLLGVPWETIIRRLKLKERVRGAGNGGGREKVERDVRQIKPKREKTKEKLVPPRFLVDETLENHCQ